MIQICKKTGLASFFYAAISTDGILFSCLCALMARTAVNAMVQISANGCASKTPSNMNILGKISIAGIKNIPCLERDSVAASFPRPSAWKSVA